MIIETIGNAILYLGDCKEVIPNFSDLDSLVTDPPYGISFRSGRRKLRYNLIDNDDNHEHLSWSCNLPLNHSKYIFCRWDALGQVPRPKSVITWVKNNHTMGDLKHEHARKTELILFYNGKDHFFPQKRPHDVQFFAKSGNKFHPTEKPIDLMMEIVGWTSGTVLDPFMGSGSTGVACMNLGRKFIGVEINEEYFNRSCERINKVYEELKVNQTWV